MNNIASATELEARLRDAFCDDSCIGHERGCSNCPLTEAIEYMITVERERDETFEKLNAAHDELQKQLDYIYGVLDEIDVFAREVEDAIDDWCTGCNERCYTTQCPLKSLQRAAKEAQEKIADIQAKL